MNDDTPRWFGALFGLTLAATSLALLAMSVWTIVRVVRVATWLAP